MSELILAREYLMSRRRALLIELDAIETALELPVKNVELRKEQQEREKAERITDE